jgi:hypothetical protein
VADFALVRGRLVHLSFAHGRAVIANIKRSARYLAASNDFDLWCNGDMLTGEIRPINLLRRPYAFPPPWWRMMAVGPELPQYRQSQRIWRAYFGMFIRHDFKVAPLAKER